MQIIELMNLRSNFEDITSDYKLPENFSGSDINSLNWFIENGHKSNSLRNDFRRALEIAELIVTEYENDRSYEEDGRGSRRS